jgi:uncharacterized protein YbjT (DUF2867 family)
MQMFTSGPLLAAVHSGVIRLAADFAKISWIDARDVASVAAVALLSVHGHVGQAYILTGDQSLDHAEVAAVIQEATGRSIRYEAITEDEARRALSEAGFPPRWVDRLVRFYRLVRQGFAAPTSPAVQDLLGRPARTFAAFAREHAATWRA